MPDDDVTVLRALAHPSRLRILSLLTGTAMSAAEVARELDLTHANASYHLRLLADAGELVEAGEEKIRGGVAKRYRHPWAQERAVDRDRSSDQQSRELYLRTIAEEMVRRFRQRRPRTRAHLTDAEMWVTPDVWRRVTALVAEAAELVHAEAQPPRTSGTLHVNLNTVMFEMDRT